MATRLHKLAITSPLHVGSVGVGSEETLTYIPNDTLFAALTVTWLEIGLEKQVVRFDTSFAPGVQPPLLLSSAFPYAGDVLLLPRPHLSIMPGSGGKEYKRVRWVSPAVFKQMIASISIKRLEELWERRSLIQGGTIWLTAPERVHVAQTLGLAESPELSIWARNSAPHVAVDRTTSAGNLYYVGQVHFAEECGLWFMADGESSWLEYVRNALTFMQDGGIGGRRFRGGGQFRLSELANPLDLNDEGNYQVLLGRLAPTIDQMKLLKAEYSRYDLVTIGGYSDYPRQTPVIRKRVRLLTEGSVIMRGSTAAGQLVDVNPDGEEGKGPLVDHPIYRYGFGFGVPMRVGTASTDVVREVTS